MNPAVMTFMSGRLVRSACPRKPCPLPTAGAGP